jgi:hypothetical protein
MRICVKISFLTKRGCSMSGKNKKRVLTFEQLDATLSYVICTGELFWKQGKQGRDITKRVGFLRADGARQLTIGGVTYLEHIIVWILNTKSQPSGKIAHLNGVKSDNRFENLVLLNNENNTLTQFELKKRLSYNEETGLFDRVFPKNTPVGATVNDEGYLNILVNNQLHRAHRLVWLYVHGVFPTKYIDHINGIRNDNRLINLREVSNTENLHNQKIRLTNTSGFKGVSWSKQRQKWQAQCCVNYIKTHLGYFDTPEEASKVYNDFAKIAHGRFYRDTTK